MLLICFQKAESTSYRELHRITEHSRILGGHLVQPPAQSRSWLTRCQVITARDSALGMKRPLKTCLPLGNREGTLNAGELQTTSSFSDRPGASCLLIAFL